MALSIKRINIWRLKHADEPGLLGRVLAPLAQSGVDLQVVMGYHVPEGGGLAVIEVAPVSGRKAEAAAREAGFAPSASPSLLVLGDNKVGLGHRIGEALGGAGINMHYLVAQVIGRKFQAVAGFGSEDDARRASALIKKAATKK